MALLNAQADRIQTLRAKVDFEPAAGSVYSGVIREYHDVKGFILMERPATIRIIGQAPVVRTDIFDMVSDGDEFRLSIPPKRKFIVGKTSFAPAAKNALENLRPQHILDALVVPGIDPARDKYAFEEEEAAERRYYVITVLRPSGAGEFFPERKVWFDRTNLEVSRFELYGPQGAEIENVEYSGYQDFDAVHYPTRIEIRRPVEDYRLAITLESATFNQAIPPEEFDLKKPHNAELVELSALSGREAMKHGN